MTWKVTLDERPAPVNEPITVAVVLGENGETFLHRSVRLDAIPSPRDMADLRWYLEEFPNYPFDPAPAVAAAAQERMEQVGRALFTSLRATVADPRFDHALGAGLDTTSIEIRGMSGHVPWELLRNPESGRIPAVHAKRMVRVVPGATRAAPQVSGDARLLLVVSRPLGAHDVGFQSVARPLLSTLAAQGAFDVTVLRPPTHAALRDALAAAQERGRPFDLVHFDGHGLRQDGMGMLVFEGAGRGDPAELVSGAAFGANLAGAGVRIAVLNACRSASVGPADSPHALRSLAEELVLAGLSGTVAMQYDVRVDTAARFVVPLYAALAAGLPLGDSVTDARRALYRAMRAARERGSVPTIDDWCVPIVYEAERVLAPQPLAPASERRRTAAIYDPAFHGRDDVLLQIDRAFGETPTIVLTGMSGSGKTTTARQFARWYEATGGITGGVVEVEIGSDLGRPSECVLAALGGSVETASAPPGLLIVDGVDAPPLAERHRLDELFAGLIAAGGRILVTTNTVFWHAGAEEIRLGALTDGDMVDILADQLFEPVDEAALAAYRPVIDLANGNPLALETLVGWASEVPHRAPAPLRALVDDVLCGEGPELPERAREALERLTVYFLGPDDWQRLLVLLHRQRYADIDQLVTLGKPDTPEHLEELAEVTGEQWGELFTHLSVAGLAWQVHDDYFELHPLFASVLADGVGDARDPARIERIERTFAFLMHSIGSSISAEQLEGDNYERNLQWATSEEHNLRHAHTLAMQREWWDLVNGPLEGLRVGHAAAGRRREWSALVSRTAEYAVAADGGALPGREALWARVASWLHDIAMTEGEFREARIWGERLVAHQRSRDRPYDLAVALVNLAMPVRELNDPACLTHLDEAQGLLDKEDQSARPLLAGIHFHLGISYQELSDARDLARAFEEFGASLELWHPRDEVRRARCISQQAEVVVRAALQNWPSPHAESQLDAAWQLSTQALALLPATALDDHAVIRERLGRIARKRENFDEALAHDMAARACHERTDHIAGQAGSRYYVALDLRGLGRLKDARVYATAAEAVFASLGEPGRKGREAAERLCAELAASV